MSKIKELAERMAEAQSAADQTELGAPDFMELCQEHREARAALQAEVERMEAENKDHIQQLRKEQLAVQTLADKVERTEAARWNAAIEAAAQLVERDKTPNDGKPYSAAYNATIDHQANAIRGLMK